MRDSLGFLHEVYFGPSRSKVPTPSVNTLIIFTVFYYSTRKANNYLLNELNK